MLLFHGQFLLCQFFAQSFLQKNNYCIGTIGDVPASYSVTFNPAECQGTAALLDWVLMQVALAPKAKARFELSGECVYH